MNKKIYVAYYCVQVTGQNVHTSLYLAIQKANCFSKFERNVWNKSMLLQLVMFLLLERGILEQF